jgi:hypothetical protein
MQARRRQDSPIPNRKSNIPLKGQRKRAKTSIESPIPKSKSLLKNLNIRSKETNLFMKNLRDTSQKRGISPTLKTSIKKIVNNANLLKYEEDKESKMWFREVNQKLFEFGKSNDLENFFFNGMSMKDSFNGELSKSMGKVFYHSIFCLPVYLFRSSSCLSRLYLKDTFIGKLEITIRKDSKRKPQTR